MTAKVDSPPRSRVLIARGPSTPPEPLVRVISMPEEWGVGLDGESGEAVSVHCPKCQKRTYDVVAVWYPPFLSGEAAGWFSSEVAMVRRRCPRCKALSECEVTRKPGHQLEDGVDGRWNCSECGLSLARIDRVTGKIKATCRVSSCHENVPTTASRALSGKLRSVDDECERRFQGWP